MKKTGIAIAIMGLGFGLMSQGVSAADTVVKLGHVGPLTGSISHLGKDNENGALLAIEEYNAKGVTIGGKKIKFEIMGEDDQADPRAGTTVAQRLVDAEVVGVVGHLNSGTTIPASRIYHQAGIPMISPSATNPKLTQQNYAGVFRTIANDVQQGGAIGKFATGTLGAKNIAIIDDRTAYGQGLADEVEKSAKATGGKIVAREFTNDKATDFMAILTKIKAQNPDVIFFGGMDAQGGPMLRQLKQLGINAKFITGDGACSGEMLKLAGDALSGNAYCTQAGLPLDKMPGGKDFKERYKKRFNLDVQIYAPYAYDAAAAMIEAMKVADSTVPAKYLPALKAINFQGVTGNVSFDAKGDIKEGAITVYQYKDGGWNPVP
ncbi:MAG TPA: branched-chain amino acid ABC transporter substrate-binding protein [Denitromonas sp.]|uniref:branched-chain amino acid ABC transporter substrate-binding protein n=1 Tax=Denitromonas sp. TaxID=2734609 RepID=UPI001D7A624E|nr:branched-chain amino acid ABC transporter substrate-binding protein [Rhodocyclaceae bacterium]MCP5223506.1 branched-chain amino acid ABC transporter substrate-binding protein [Zoogloeaceae bacterium]HQU87727.1 branched-chain amino acid ABC transporter substrate-binding protein [Denitromonas sp.]HQV13968.1 branched-chain amino acid ABC transporter substrate-binding protein [Denitromonas sp.]